MNKKRIALAVTAAVLLILFALFTLALKKVDVQPVGANGTDVGLASFNERARVTITPAGEGDYSKTNELMHKLSTVLMLAGFGCACVFFLMWLCQIFKYRTFTAPLDGELYLLGLLYGAVLVLYIVFEKVELNLRPPVLNALGENMAEAEASYPSSHVLFAVTMLGSAMLYLRSRVFSGTFKGLIIAGGVLLCAAAIATRTLSGRHWATDIIGAVLLSLSLLCAYEAAACTCRRRVARPSGSSGDSGSSGGSAYSDPAYPTNDYAPQPLRDPFTPAEKK